MLRLLTFFLYALILSLSTKFFDAFAFNTHCETALEELVRKTDYREFLKAAVNGGSDYWYLMRGVAPAEAMQTAETNVRGEGRRATMGEMIPKQIVPAYVVNADAQPSITRSERREMFKGARYYAALGAILEKHIKEHPEDAILSFYDLTDKIKIPDDNNTIGYVLIYRVPKSMKLEFHPESGAMVNQRVVALPENGELVGSFPSNYITLPD